MIEAVPVAGTFMESTAVMLGISYDMVTVSVPTWIATDAATERLDAAPADTLQDITESAVH